MIRYCKGCNVELTEKQKIFCCHSCQARYNFKIGRHDPTGSHWHWSEQSRKRKSEQMKGKPSCRKGKKWKSPATEEQRRKREEGKQKRRASMLGKRHPHSLATRLKLSEIGKTKIGPLASNWIDGRSFKPYSVEFNAKLKEKIKARDGYICKLCGIKKEESTLSIHHIDYNKENNDDYNLVTLCLRCNSKVNRNREFYKKLFKIFIFYWEGKEHRIEIDD